MVSGAFTTLAEDLIKTATVPKAGVLLDEIIRVSIRSFRYKGIALLALFGRPIS